MFIMPPVRSAMSPIRPSLQLVPSIVNIETDTLNQK
jgi:hypothetical protein